MLNKAQEFFDIVECVAAKANLKEDFAVSVSEFNFELCQYKNCKCIKK